MTIREKVLQALTNDNLTDQQIAQRTGLNEPSVRRARRELELDGVVEYKSEDYGYSGRRAMVWGLDPSLNTTPVTTPV